MSNQQIADRLTERIAFELGVPQAAHVIRELIIAELDPHPVLQFADKAPETRAAQRIKVLSSLKAAGSQGRTNVELSKICLRFGARLKELRDKGYRITTERVESGIFKYTLGLHGHGW